MADPVRAILPDGRVLEFPAGTDGATIQKTVRAQLGVDKPADSGSFLDNIGRAVARGATLGFADEIAAGGDALLGHLAGRGSQADSFDKRYEENLATERARDRAFDKANPIASNVAQIGGGVAGTAAALPASVLKLPATYLGAVKQGAKVGGAAGAIGGFGEGEQGLGNRAANAAVAGTFGAGLGAALPAALVPAKKGIEAVRRAVGAYDPEQLAMGKVGQAFERDSIPVEEAGTRLAMSDKPQTLFDVGGENVRGLARAAAGSPGPAKQSAVRMLEERQAGQAGRVSSNIDNTMRSAGGGFYENIDDLLRQRSTGSRPLYDEAYAHNDGFAWSDTLHDLMKRPAVKEALSRAERLAADEGVAAKELTFSRKADGSSVAEQYPTFRGWDYVKRGLDDVVDSNRNPYGRLNQQGRAVDQIRRAVLDELDHINPKYAEARSAYAGPSRSLEALEMGRKALTADSEITAREIAKLSQGDRDFFREGLKRAIQDIVQNTPDGADAVKRIFGRPALREKIEAAFQDRMAFAKFRSAMEAEAAMYRNAQSVSPRSGSQTELRMAEKADLGDSSMLGDVATAMVSGASPWRAVLGQIADRSARALSGVTPKTAPSLTGALFSTDQAANAATIAAVQREIARRQAAAQALNNRMGLGYFGAGSFAAQEY